MNIRKVLPLVRKFALYAWQCKKSYFIFYVLSILVNIAAPFVTIIFPAYVIDELIGQRRISHIVLYVALTVGLTWVCNCLRSFSDLTKEKYDDLFGRYLNMVLSEKCIDLDFQHTEDTKVLEQLEKAKTGIDWYSGGISGILNTFGILLTNIVIMFGVAAILLTGAPVLIAVYVVCIAVDTVLRFYMNKIEREAFLKLSKVNRIFGYLFWELQDIRFGKDIRLYGAEKLMEEKCAKENNYQTNAYKTQSMQALPYDMASTLMGMVRYIADLLILGKKALTVEITLGAFTMYMNAGNAFHQSLRAIVWNVQDLYRKLSYANEFVIFMEYPNAIRHGELLPQTDREHTIEFRNVSFTYPGSDICVLRNINITLHAGEHISIVGLNGAGKTTFIKLLCRLYDPTEGQILLDGTDIRELVYEEYVKLLAVVFQDFELFAFTARENVTLTESHAKASDVLTNEEKLEKEYKERYTRKKRLADAKTRALARDYTDSITKTLDTLNDTRTDLDAAQDNARFDHVIEQVGLTETLSDLKYGADTFVMKGFDEEGCELSGGQKQKLAIARALYKDAPIVILDEPTAALDPIAEYEIYNQFNTLVGGKTAIYISHRLSSCKFCDIIYVFVNGEIREHGTHDELVSADNGCYAEMFAAQAQYYR